MKVPAAKKLPSGAWRCQIQIDGQRMSVTAPTKREAERQAAGLKAGFLESQRRDSTTLKTAIDKYMASKSNVLSASTVRGYCSMRDNHFQRLMDKNIYTLTVRDVQAAVNDLAATHSPKTVANNHGLLHAVLRYYGINLEGVQLPQAQSKERRWIQDDEIHRLLREIDGDFCELPILLALWLGMRRSEIMGLCWDSVDLERGLLVVRRAYVYGEDQGRWVLQERAKTRGSQRVIPLPEYILERFRRLEPGDGEERIFTMEPGRPRKRLQRACRRAGITVTHMHGLRHTFAAVMLREGVDERIVMRQGGWTSPRTMREIYDYIMDDDAKDAQNARDRFFAPE